MRLTAQLYDTFHTYSISVHFSLDFRISVLRTFTRISYFSHVQFITLRLVVFTIHDQSRAADGGGTAHGTAHECSTSNSNAMFAQSSGGPRCGCSTAPFASSSSPPTPRARRLFGASSSALETSKTAASVRLVSHFTIELCVHSLIRQYSAIRGVHFSQKCEPFLSGFCLARVLIRTHAIQHIYRAALSTLVRPSVQHLLSNNDVHVFCVKRIHA